MGYFLKPPGENLTEVGVYPFGELGRRTGWDATMSAPEGKRQQIRFKTDLKLAERRTKLLEAVS